MSVSMSAIVISPDSEVELEATEWHEHVIRCAYGQRDSGVLGEVTGLIQKHLSVGDPREVLRFNIGLCIDRDRKATAEFFALLFGNTANLAALVSYFIGQYTDGVDGLLNRIKSIMELTACSQAYPVWLSEYLFLWHERGFVAPRNILHLDAHAALHFASGCILTDDVMLQGTTEAFGIGRLELPDEERLTKLAAHVFRHLYKDAHGGSYFMFGIKHLDIANHYTCPPRFFLAIALIFVLSLQTKTPHEDAQIFMLQRFCDMLGDLKSGPLMTDEQWFHEHDAVADAYFCEFDRARRMFACCVSWDKCLQTLASIKKQQQFFWGTPIFAKAVIE